MSKPKHRITRFLQRSPSWLFTLYATTAGFALYFCMYAYRKPFAASSYTIPNENIPLAAWPKMHVLFLGYEVDFKTLLVISQIIGYALSKFIGIKICSEMPRRRRVKALLGFILLAQLSLFLFAVLPNNWKVAAMFLNGIPLGFIWGLVVWYLEGRKASEIMLAGLSCSFIVGSSTVKDIGKWLMQNGVDQFWMPFVMGLIFLLPFAFFVWMLDQLPEPSLEDVHVRSERSEMLRSERWAFVRTFMPSLVLLCVAYFFLTAYRDFRDNFGQEIFNALGYGKTPAIFTKTDLPIAFGVMSVLALLNLIKNNKWGLICTFGVMTFGMVLLGVSTFLYDIGQLDGAVWMVWVGLGTYLMYIPYGSVLFDRLIASTRVLATAVFTIYIADAVGYTGSIAIQLYKEFGQPKLNYLEFFRYFSYSLAIGGAILLVMAASLIFYRHTHYDHNKL